MKSTDLVYRLQATGLVVDTLGPVTDDVIRQLTCDSRAAGEGACFVAISGKTVDGHQYIDNAIEAGAQMVICERIPETAPATVRIVQVENARAAWAQLAAVWHGDPARLMQMAGITGTNGKTTTATLVHQALQQLAPPAGLVGTVAVRIGDEEHTTEHTTPDAFTLQRLLQQMQEAGCDRAVMEVSSHALEQHRVGGIPFTVAAFTNLSQDHLDYHPSFDAYLNAKKRLFDALSPDATAVVNADDPHADAIVADTPAGAVVRYGTADTADIHLQIDENTLGGLLLSLNGEQRRYNLVGAFNAYNIACAFGVLRGMGFAEEEVLNALEAARPVPGRFEQFRFDDGTTAVVDYAHTPDALENVLTTLRALMPENATLWCVFGCGGDRDRTKRPLMGQVAERCADRVIVTSDNPRSEDPESIMQDIRAGLDRPKEAQWIADRRTAIRSAARQANPGDVVLVAGKGHETYQIIGDRRLAFDDRHEVSTLFLNQMTARS